MGPRAQPIMRLIPPGAWDRPARHGGTTEQWDLLLAFIEKVQQASSLTTEFPSWTSSSMMPEFSATTTPVSVCGANRGQRFADKFIGNLEGHLSLTRVQIEAVTPKEGS